MIRRLYILIISLTCASFIYSQNMSSSNSETDSDTAAYVVAPKVKQFQKPVYRGLSVHFDVASPIMGLLNKSADVYGFEGQIDVNLYNRLFPILEAGYASVIKDTDLGAKYQSHSPFFRIGLNYSLIKPYDDEGNARLMKNYPFVGLRYGLSPMNYSMENIVVSDEYWGESEYRNYSSMFNVAGWLEVVGGVRIDLYKGLTLGWLVRYKTLLHSYATDKSFLCYVPGYGSSSSSVFSFSYTVGYTFR